MTSWLDKPIEPIKRRRDGQPIAPVVPDSRKVFVLPRRPQPVPPPAQREADADDIIWFIQNKCYVPEGKLMGTKFRLARWQKREIARRYWNDGH